MSRKLTVRDIVLCGLFTALIAIGAFIRIPVPVVPFTLQFLFTMLAGLLLGGRLGAISVGAYVILGLIGLPIFTDGGGPGYVFQPTFGYLIGFIIASGVTGSLANKVAKPSYKRLLAADFIGLVIVYTFGLVYCYFISNFYLGKAVTAWVVFLYGFILAVPGDIFLCIAAAVISKKVIPIVHSR
ncbi:biotin transporter BioY [Pectinatus sottacetonis]|uniref:biotin transporter BioY n=1 Tax=Pectinatus sottacetonis TaxID=1002795 RepID=UPI0018C837CF|nr:biotin transporter BioY [Pectinatus sottacetonis]